MAAENALNNSSIVEIEISENVNLQFDYLILSDIMKLVKDFGLKILEQDFSEEWKYENQCSYPTKRKIY